MKKDILLLLCISSLMFLHKQSVDKIKRVTTGNDNALKEQDMEQKQPGKPIKK
ncbi:MAG: hypothetical protein M3Z26_09010 [Bacteroidota bacterium]|nr:hypothetical protein [Bacteroidota bacterium]